MKIGQFVVKLVICDGMLMPVAFKARRAIWLGFRDFTRRAGICLHSRENFPYMEKFGNSGRIARDRPVEIGLAPTFHYTTPAQICQ